MKKYFILFGFLSNYAAAQVGVNTSNPQQMFHIDGLYSSTTSNPSSGLPSEAQQVDDFVVTSNAEVGLGTITPSGKLDLISTNSGFVPPRLSIGNRDALTVDYRPTSTMIYNVDLKKYQINIGTAQVPDWRTLATIPDTANTTVSFSKTDQQEIYFDKDAAVNFNVKKFDNTPSGYVTQIDENFNLRAGKTYKLEVILGSFVSNNHNHTLCYLRNSNDNSTITSTSILAHSRKLEWNTINSMSAFVKVVDNDIPVKVVCAKANAGFVTVNSNGVPPVFFITIMD